MLRVVVAAIVLSGCVVSASHNCTDGRVCGAGSICDDTHHLCVSQDQLDQCKTADDRTPCTSDVTVGLCDQGVCLPACGDSEKQATEECDDANFINHDGCSSTCSVETGAWSRIPDPWSARWGHTLTYDDERNVLVLFGGMTSGDSGMEPEVSADTWESAAGTWSRIDGAAPPARRAGVMAYDSDRHVSVLFGGVGDDNVFLGDTWEYDGVWRQVMTATAPPARQFAAMAYNPTTQRIVLHGGIDTVGAIGDIWEYDGATWSPMTTTGSAPGPRFGHVMAFDAARDHMVVFAENTTWELASNGAWSEHVGTQPPTRRFASMTYVPDRQVMVMTGGRDLFTGTFLNDTWEYTTAWTRVPTPTAPDAVEIAALAAHDSTAVLVGGIAQNGSATHGIWQYGTTASGLSWGRLESGLIPTARFYSPLVYDPLRHELVTYSDGAFGAGIRNDTYTFDGGAWHRRAQGPAARSGHAMTFDPARGQIVMVGGDPGGTPVDETWTWNGVTWSLLVPAGTKPPPRVLPALAADPGLGRVVLFGGSTTYVDGDLSDTWELDGSTWTQVTTQNRPAGGRGAAMSYDPDAGHIILFDTSGATWTYVDRDWAPVTASPSPPPRSGPVFVHDSSRHRMVLYGGSTTSELLADMWQLDGTTWTPIMYDLAPQPAIAPGGAYFPETRALVLVGGGVPNATQQMWQFRYSSQDPDEVCDALDIDEDLDGLVDCADPDCVCN